MSKASPIGNVQNAIRTWLHRSTASRGVVAFGDNLLILATDMGFQRKENQDRIAAIHAPRSNGRSQSFHAIAVADGMGGMTAGAECAEITISAFFSALLQNTLTGKTLDQAARFANQTVYEFSKGRGGATLAAVVVSENEAYQVHVGDSRIYEMPNSRAELLKRLTVDDSLEEVVGGHGRELIQFMGMGDGIRPHVAALPMDKPVMITSDGVHFLEHSLIQTICRHSPSPRSTAERLLALSRWAGSPDNASLAIITTNTLQSNGIIAGTGSIELLDAFSALTILMSSDALIVPTQNLDQPALAEPINAAVVNPAQEKPASYREMAPKRKPMKTKKLRGPTLGKGSSEAFDQLKIEIKEEATPQAAVEPVNDKGETGQ